MTLLEEIKELVGEIPASSSPVLPPPEACVRKTARIKKLLQGKASFRHFMIIHEVLKRPPGDVF